MLKRVDELQPGDRLDLQGDKYADNGQHPEFEFEYQPVYDIDRETPDCLVVHCDNYACGFPPDHVVVVADDLNPATHTPAIIQACAHNAHALACLVGWSCIR